MLKRSQSEHFGSCLTSKHYEHEFVFVFEKTTANQNYVLHKYFALTGLFSKRSTKIILENLMNLWFGHN